MEKDTAFKKQEKKEVHQFFITSSNRFNEENRGAYNRQNFEVGPGSYDPKNLEHMHAMKTRANTAAFLTKRTDNVFGIKDKPGPQDY